MANSARGVRAPQGRFVCVSEAATILGVSKQSIRNYCRNSGELVWRSDDRKLAPLETGNRVDNPAFRWNYSVDTRLNDGTAFQKSFWIWHIYFSLFLDNNFNYLLNSQLGRIKINRLPC